MIIKDGRIGSKYLRVKFKSRFITRVMKRRKFFTAFHLSALRVISGFRTVALVLARVIPIAMLADKMGRIYFSRLVDIGRISEIIAEEPQSFMCTGSYRCIS